MPQQATCINRLDRGDGSQIRIDWIGDVVGHQYKDVRVVTSRWTSLRKWTDTSHGDAVETVHIPIAYLRFLRVGDIWEGGVCQASQVVATASFPDVLIDESTSEILPSGARVIDKGVEGPFLLPFGFFDGHREHTTSLVTRIRVNASTSLVVPCMELVRFYFGASSSLLRGVFAGALARRELIKGSSINRVTGNANVALPEGIDSSAATAIARIAFDAAAERALNMLVQSGVAASVDGRKWYPRMGFPLRGRTTLNVKGLWFKQDGHETFLVHRLMSCTYPLPYKKLFYWKGTAAHDELRQARAVRRGAEKITLPAKAKVTLNNRPIFGSRQIVSLEAISEVDPFPDLAGKPSIYAGNVLVVGATRREAASEDPPRQLSAGGHCGPTTTGVDIIASVGGTVDEAAIPDLLWCMEAAVREVRPDVRALSFDDGRSMRRIWFGQSEVDGVGAFNGWIALLESEAASRFRTPTIALINAERQLDEGNAEFLMTVVSSQDPNDIVEKVQTFLRAHGWRTGGSKDAGVECVIALSTGEINEIVRRDPYEITNLVVSKC